MHRLNGPQTTGRDYRNLSEPQYHTRRDNNVAIAMRDGTPLMADVHRPDAQDRFPALIAASPYPRQIQDLGAPMGFIEAGVTDFWVPRGYVHVIAICAVRVAQAAPSASSKPRSVATCTTSSNGWPRNRGATAMSG